MKSFQRSKALRVALWFTGGLLILTLLNVTGQGLNTLDRLAFVERERDGWQRAPAIVAQLGLHDGSRVVDLGCGAGYFALKLSAAVGRAGNVQAVDILRLPLTFLWLRAMKNGARNLHVVLGDADNPHITGPVNAVLVANTYHELSQPAIVLGHLRLALVPGGHLVITDRSEPAASGGHASDPFSAEAELRRSGFDILSRNDHFLDQPGEGPWWLITAARPYNEAKL